MLLTRHRQRAMNKIGNSVGAATGFSLCQKHGARPMGGSLAAVILFASCAPLPTGKQSPVKPDDSADPVVFRYVGRPYTVQDLTLISYRDAKLVIDAESKSFSLTTNPPMSPGFLNPATDAWKPASQAGLNDFYKHQLAGAVNCFVVARSFELLQQKYKIDVTRYYRAGAISDYTTKTAELTEKFNDLLVSSVTTGSGDGMYRQAMIEFPHGPWRPNAWNDIWDNLKQASPYYIVNYRCLPLVAKGQVAPWYRDQIASQLVHTYVTGIIDQSRNKYVKILEDRFGRPNYFVIQSAHRGKPDGRCFGRDNRFGFQ